VEIDLASPSFVKVAQYINGPSSGGAALPEAERYERTPPVHKGSVAMIDLLETMSDGKLMDMHQLVYRVLDGRR